MSFLKPALIFPQAMVKIVSLPTNPCLTSNEFLGLCDQMLHFMIAGKCNQRVQVVRHQQKQMHMPFVTRMTKAESICHHGRNGFMTQLIFPTLCAIDRNEKDRVFPNP